MAHFSRALIDCAAALSLILLQFGCWLAAGFLEGYASGQSCPY